MEPGATDTMTKSQAVLAGQREFVSSPLQVMPRPSLQDSKGSPRPGNSHPEKAASSMPGSILWRNAERKPALAPRPPTASSRRSCPTPSAMFGCRSSQKAIRLVTGDEESQRVDPGRFATRRTQTLPSERRSAVDEYIQLPSVDPISAACKNHH